MLGWVVAKVMCQWRDGKGVQGDVSMEGVRCVQGRVQMEGWVGCVQGEVPMEGWIGCVQGELSMERRVGCVQGQVPMKGVSNMSPS